MQLDPIRRSQAGRGGEVDSGVADRGRDAGEGAGLVLDLDDQVERNRRAPSAVGCPNALCQNAFRGGRRSVRDRGASPRRGCCLRSAPRRRPLRRREPHDRPLRGDVLARSGWRRRATGRGGPSDRGSVTRSCTRREPRRSRDRRERDSCGWSCGGPRGWEQRFPSRPAAIPPERRPTRCHRHGRHRRSSGAPRPRRPACRGRRAIRS